MWPVLEVPRLSCSRLLAVMSSALLTSANSLLAWLKAVYRAFRVASHFSNEA